MWWQTMGKACCATVLLASIGAQAASTNPPGDVMSAIAADAQRAPATNPASPPPSGLQSQAVDLPSEDGQPLAVEAQGACSVQDGNGQWRPTERLTYTQCVDALDHSPEQYDANGLKHAYWQGTYLSASRGAIYESRNGQDWNKLRDRTLP